MTLLRVPLPDSTIRILHERATNHGVAVEEYVASLAEKDAKPILRFSDPIFDPIRERSCHPANFFDFSGP